MGSRVKRSSRRIPLHDQDEAKEEAEEEVEDEAPSQEQAQERKVSKVSQLHDVQDIEAHQDHDKGLRQGHKKSKGATQMEESLSKTISSSRTTRAAPIPDHVDLD